MSRVERIPGYLVDASIALVVLAMTLSIPTEAARAFATPGVVLAALAAFPLVARRRAPLTVLVLIGAASTALVWLGYLDGSAPGLLVGFYSLAASRRALVRKGLTGACVTGLFLLHLVAAREAADAGYPSAPLFVLFWAGAWVIGGRVRERRERLADPEGRGIQAECGRETSAS